MIAETRKTIVYVDDEQDLIDLVSTMSRYRGFHIVGANGGQAGLETIRRVKPDLVLLDLMMPDMGGEQVYQHLQNDLELEHIPVVIVTADSTYRTRFAGEQILKANGFVTKPFNMRELFDTIERVLNSRLTMYSHTDQRFGQDLLVRYLGLLGVPKRPPSLDALGELVAAHLMHVPFENVSKLYYRKHMGLNNIPDIATYLDGIERYHFGGTCYSNNYYFYLLLANLGYAAKLCGADMNNPDAHMISMVTVEGREYLVDVGYAAPFLAPLPRDLTEDYTIVLGRDRYVLKPQDANGCSRLELYRDGNLKHGYLAKPAPKQIEDFSVADSFRADATFMNALLLVRFYRDRSLVIHNLTVIESQGTASKSHSLNSRDELGRVVERHFGIPKGIVMEAVGELRQLNDAWN